MRLKKKVAQLIARERVCRVATVNEHGQKTVQSVKSEKPVQRSSLEGPRRATGVGKIDFQHRFPRPARDLR